MIRTVARCALAIALVLTAEAACAQSPAAEWRTIETAHFRVHYPVEYAAWSERAASRLESIRSAVTAAVGCEPPQRIDVIVSNPIALPNGVAWPFLDAPRILLFAEPPGPEEQIGAYSSWIDLVAVHEVTHIVHMLRPSRNPLQRISERLLLPLDPITLSGPRWVLEGYATVIEGRLTGAGRPSSTMRASILRKWAASGRLPSYSQLDSDSRFLGMSMAYLAGSAFLEWLESRSGPDSLRHLWARMTARRKRSFEDAFTGVFGDSPERLYGQFTAELTASAMTVNRAADLREGELWQDTKQWSGDPAVSPDGKFIAVVLRERNKPQKLVIWSTGPAEEEERKDREQMEKVLRRDPEDVGPVRSRPLKRKPEHSLTLPDGGDIETPRWTRDGKAIVFAHRQPDGDGFLHHDLFLWRPELSLTRVTQLADVRDADPMPDGRSAVAVRSRFGLSQLVNVNLSSGAVTELTEPSLDIVYSHPRVNRDGSAIAYVANRAGKWVLEMREGTTSRGLVENAASPEWLDGDLVATISSGGFAEIHRIHRDGSHVPLTRSSGAASDPAPSPDGRLFSMGLEPQGFVVRVVSLEGEAAAQPAFDPALVPALPPAPATPPAFATAPLPPAHPYGVGRQEVSSVVGQIHGPDQDAIEIGVRVGDLVGRLDTIAVGSLGRRNGQRGAAIASAWRGWPVGVSAHLFTADDDRVERNGVELRGFWRGQWPLTRLAVDAGALGGDPLDLAFLALNVSTRQVAGSWRIEESVEAAGESGTLDHARGVGRLVLRSGSTRLGLEYQRDAIRDGVMEVGGLHSSIVPDSALPNRVFDPALRVGALTGKWHEGRRVELTMSGLTLFVQEHRTDLDRVRVGGVELATSSDPLPVLRLSAFDLTLGVARQLGSGADRDVKWWFGLRWRP